MRQEYIGFGVLAVLLIGGLLFAKMVGLGNQSPMQAELQVISFGPLTISSAWIAVPIAGQPRTSAYLTVHNSSAIDERLMGASSPVAASTHLHRTVTEDNISRMDGVDAVILPADGEIRFRPGAYHIMMMNVEGNLSAGDFVPLTLHFLEAGDVTFDVPVRARADMLDAGH